MASYKNVQIETTVDSAISDAVSAITDLAGEMRDWADNMENGNLGHTEKCEAVGSCADELENVDQSLELPDTLAAFKDEALKVNISMHKAKKYGEGSRSNRRDNAVSLLTAAKEWAGEKATEFREKEDTTDEDTELAQELEQLESDLDDAIGYAESAEFPGMYG